MASGGEKGASQQKYHSVVGAEINISLSASMKAEQNKATGCVMNAATAVVASQQHELKNKHDQVGEGDAAAGVVVETAAAVDFPTSTSSSAVAVNKKLLLCRRFKDSGGILRNFNSLPLFVYATSPSTHATSADGVGVAKEAAAAAAAIINGDKNDSYDLALCTTIKSGIEAVVGAMDCLPLGGSSHHHTMPTATVTSGSSGGGQLSGSGAPTVAVVGAGGLSYPHHLNLNHHHHMLGHHSPYSNNYPLQHSSSHHHIHSDQTKSLQELQHEVGALLEFRDLVIETFPDLKHKMASMSSASSAAAIGGSSVTNASVSGTNTLTGGGGGMSHSSLASRREWEPGIRIKRKLSQKEPSTSIAATQAAAATGNGVSNAAAAATAAGELSSSSLTRSRSNSHSGKKEPKSGETNNGSVVQDSGFSTETSSSKEGHSASSTNGAMTGTIALNRLSCPESDDELLNLLDVIHRKSNRLREEMEHLQNYERQNLRGGVNSSSNSDEPSTAAEGNTAAALAKSTSGSSTVSGGLTPKTFREHVERLNKEDIKQLRKERDRLLDKLAEMEAETLTGRIKAAKMNDQVEELISVKKDLEGQLKLALAQKLELSSRVQQLQLQQSKSSSSQSDFSSQRNFLTSATTVLSTGSGASHLESTTTLNASGSTVPSQNRSRLNNTFQPVVLEQQQDEVHHFAFHQSAGSDNHKQQLQQQQLLGHLDGIVSTPGGRNTKCRLTESKRFTAILLETSVIELQRHLLTLTVQNQVLMQKLDQAGKSKNHLAKRLDKSKEDVDDLRFQLEEKNIELEGTKAQLRVLESRIHSHTPSSGATTNSYLHSQNDYETNRSSASTTLMLSRRGLSGSGNDSHYSDIMCSATPTSQAHLQMPPSPNVTQISTPSMKAMVHLPMDEIQQHSSSTESAHDHELQHHEVLPQSVVSRLMSTSVGGVSPFEHNLLSPRAGHQSTAKKFNVGASATASKPSKIPLPGSKAAAYFAGKPPSGRPSTAGRSPPSAHNSSAISSASSKSSLSRSTGNLLYSKSPNSLKRTDSAQSIRKELANNSNSSFGTNNSSRSSTSSSIPMAATPHGTNAAVATSAFSKSTSATTPSPRVLQNSPLPKLKRESLTSRVRHLDSLSRVHQHNNYNHTTSSSNSSPTSNASDASNVSVTTTTSSPPATAGNYTLISSTPKTSTIAAQLNSSLRKDLQLSSSSISHGSQQFPRRATGGGGAGATTSPTTTSGHSNGRRYNNSATGSSSVVVARMAARTNNLEQNGGHEQHTNSSGVANGGANASDSDSGKNSSFYYNSPIDLYDSNINNNSFGHSPGVGVRTIATRNLKWQEGIFVNCQKMQTLSNNCNEFYDDISLLNLKQHQHKRWNHGASAEGDGEGGIPNIATIARQEYGNHYFDFKPYGCKLKRFTEQEKYFMMDDLKEGCDKLLVTFDYGYSDSIEAEMSQYWQVDYENAASTTTASIERRMVFAIKEEYDEEYLQEQEEITMESITVADAKRDKRIWAQGKSVDQYKMGEHNKINLPKSVSVRRQAFQSKMRDADDCTDDGNTDDWPFKVHHMQYDLNNDSIQLYLSSLTEYEIDSGDDVDIEFDDTFIDELKLKSDCNALERKMLNYVNDFDEQTINDDDDVDDFGDDAAEGNAAAVENELEGEEFYDSIECT